MVASPKSPLALATVRPFNNAVPSGDVVVCPVPASAIFRAVVSPVSGVMSLFAPFTALLASEVVIPIRVSL